MVLNLEERIQKQIKNTVLIIDENINDQDFLVSSFDPRYYSFIRSNETKDGYRLLN